MSRVALDFTRINTPNYRTYRVISAPGKWGQFYRERVAALSKFSNAIIFPEQLLSLNQKSIWGVSVTVSARGVMTNMECITGFKPSAWDAQLDTPEQIVAFEADHEPVDIKLLSNSHPVRHTSNDLQFGTLWLFTNRRDALKCLTTKLTSATGAL